MKNLKENQVYIEGVGICTVKTVWRICKDGIKTPYDVYEPIS